MTSGKVTEYTIYSNNKKIFVAPTLTFNLQDLGPQKNKLKAVPPQHAVGSEKSRCSKLSWPAFIQHQRHIKTPAKTESIHRKEQTECTSSTVVLVLLVVVHTSAQLLWCQTISSNTTAISPPATVLRWSYSKLKSEYPPLQSSSSLGTWCRRIFFRRRRGNEITSIWTKRRNLANTYV